MPKEASEGKKKMPRGKPFTAESARAARQKRTEKERREKSISKAFMALLEREYKNENGSVHTGAELIAQAIIKGAVSGNPKLIELSLALSGETPTAKVEIKDGQLADLINGLKEPCAYDLHEEATRLDVSVADGAAEKN
jgi:hypothetical protein